jgi:hypothetical protein
MIVLMSKRSSLLILDERLDPERRHVPWHVRLRFRFRFRSVQSSVSSGPPALVQVATLRTPSSLLRSLYRASMRASQRNPPHPIKRSKTRLAVLTGLPLLLARPLPLAKASGYSSPPRPLPPDPPKLPPGAQRPPLPTALPSLKTCTRRRARGRGGRMS